MQFNLKEMATFGVAGNFTGHLEQAGEAADFTKVVTVDAKAPKAVFPTYIPHAKNATPAFLGVFPFDAEKIIFPKGEEKLQIEPECAIICDVTWTQGKIESITPVLFGASNDCSIRKEGARKISQKKNWGPSSKGFSKNAIAIDSFDEKGILNHYRIASFLVRDGEVHDYGEDSAVRDYSYIYARLLTWLVDRFNNQQNDGPAEELSLYLQEAAYPGRVLVSVGATRYTDFGEHNFLMNNDKSVVVLYPEEKYTHKDIVEGVKLGTLDDKMVSVLSQIVVV